jgi:hypothetical protein
MLRRPSRTDSGALPTSIQILIRRTLANNGTIRRAVDNAAELGTTAWISDGTGVYASAINAGQAGPTIRVNFAFPLHGLSWNFYKPITEYLGSKECDTFDIHVCVI